MIQTEQSVVVDGPIAEVWNYAKDMERWAAIMPGFQTYEIIDDDNSRWVLKIGVGGLVRTVKVNVHVDRWAGPEAVDFSFALEGDPVKGGGTYRAVADGPSRTAVALGVRVEGTGPMAPMWEAMGGPVLPKFAKGFAEQLKAMIELALGPAAASPQAPAAATAAPQPSSSPLARLVALLRRLWRSIAGG